MNTPKLPLPILKIRELVTMYKKQVASPDKVLFIKNTVRSVSINVTNRSINAEHNTIEREDWSTHIYHFQQKYESSEEFKNLIALFSIYSDVLKGKPYIIQNFFNKLVITCFQTNNAAKLKKIYKEFISDLKTNNVIYRAHVDLNGIYLDIPDIKFSIEKSKIRIRKLEKADFEFEEPLIYSKPDFFPKKSAFLFIETSHSNFNEIQDVVYRMLEILQLYNVGGVNLEKLRIKTDSLKHRNMGNPIIGPANSSHPNYNYSLNNTQKKSFTKFCQTLFPITPIGVNKDASKIDYLFVAAERYRRCLLSNQIYDEKIASAVMGFEALLLTGDEKAELNYRLKLRSTKLASLANYDSTEMFEILGEAYKFRSTFVHGGISSDKDIKNFKISGKHVTMERFSYFLVNLLRKFVIIFALGKIEKKSFIKLIDQSFIRDEANSEILRMLKAIDFRLFNHGPFNITHGA